MKSVINSTSGRQADSEEAEHPELGALGDVDRWHRRKAMVPASVFVLAYFLIGIAWVGSNPPGSAPDENDHLLKALAAGHLDIGREYKGAVGATPHERLNISISRVVEVPAYLAPDGYTCSAFHSDVTAACLPTETSHSDRSVERVTVMGAYPPFAYILPGFIARQVDSPYRAFVAARIVDLVMASAMLFLGIYHLIRWLGRWALLGAFVGLTPMAIHLRPGDEMNLPLARAVIGGLAGSTLLTLFVVPVLYVLLKPRQQPERAEGQ